MSIATTAAARTARHISGLAGGGTIRYSTYENTVYTVVPVVMAIGGMVVRPLNSTGPEYVPAEELAAVPSGWNFRPILPDHPNNGLSSANEPSTLERYRFGYIFNTQYRNGALQCEAWLDPARVAKVGAAAESVLSRVLAGEMVEVSVGAMIVSEIGEGVSPSGVAYESTWRDIISDHLAMLPPGTEGACSAEMGCGSPRAAQMIALRQMAAAAALSSTQVDLPATISSNIISLGLTVEDGDLAESGRETTPHVTVKYGLHTVNPSDVKSIISNFGTIRLTLGDTDIFESDEYDVVMISVDSPDLLRLNKLISDNLDVTDTHPEYVPHVTVAYVKPGAGAKYSGISTLRGSVVVASSITFSTPSEQATEISTIDGANKVNVAANGGTSIVAQPTKPPNPLSRLWQSLTAAIRAAQGDTSGLSDSDLRMRLRDAIRAIEPGYADFYYDTGIFDVYQDSQTVVYCTYPEDKLLLFQRTYEVSPSGEVTLNDDRQQVEPGLIYKVVGTGDDTIAAAPAAASGARHSSKDQGYIETIHAAAVDLGASCASTPAAATAATSTSTPTSTTAAASSCGCGEGDNNVDKQKMKEAVARLIRGAATAEDKILLATELGLAEGEMASTPTPTSTSAPTAPSTPAPAAASAVPDHRTPEQEEALLAALPSDLRALVDQSRKDEQARRTYFTSALTRGQTEYSAADLAAMSTDQLQRTARMLKLPEVQPAAITGLRDYTGRSFPVADDGEGQRKAPPKPYTTALKGLGKRSAPTTTTAADDEPAN